MVNNKLMLALFAGVFVTAQEIERNVSRTILDSV